MSGTEDDAEKSHEPSQKRLDEARKRGDIPRSADLSAAAVYCAAALALLISGRYMLDHLGSAAIHVIEDSDRLSSAIMRAGRAPTLGMLEGFVLPVVPLVVLPMVGAGLAIAVQRGFVIAPENIAPRLSRINPLKAVSQKFGRQGLFAFGKSVFSMGTICLLVAAMVPHYAAPMLTSMRLSAGQTGSLMADIALQFLLLAGLATLAFGTLDYGWQWLQHRRRNMMTRQEMVEEHKESEGDGHVKGQRKQKGREIALSQMLQEVAKADVILVNPTHYAVALKWRRGDKSAPICVAKGVDDVAGRIRAKASEAGVPIHRDPPTTRAIYASVEVGHPIRPEHYKPVAAAIRFAEAMRKKARRK